MKPTLSVVIPVYNGSGFIESAIQSIYQQSYLPERFEIIVIDDGSLDNSYEVCLALAAKYPAVRVMRNPHNLGIAATRNLGVKSAEGEFLAMLDQDDRWHPEKLRRQFDLLNSQPDISLVLGLQEFQLSSGDQFPRWFKPEWAESPQPGYVFGCMLIRKLVFLRVGLLDENLRFGSDDVDWFGRAKSFRVPEVLIPEVVLYRNIHESNTSSQTKPFNAELLKVIRRKISQ